MRGRLRWSVAPGGTACVYTFFTTDWWIVIAGPEDVEDASELQKAIDHYRDLKNRSSYDWNHGRQHLEFLEGEMMKAADALRAIGANPANY